MYSAFFEKVEPALKRVPPNDSIVLLGDISAHVGNEGGTWRGVIGKTFVQATVNNKHFLQTQVA